MSIRKIWPILSCLILVASVFLFVTGTSFAVPTSGEEGSGGQDNFCQGTETCGNKFYEEYIKPLILVLSGLVGVVAVISIIYAGIQYAGSADDPGIVSKAKQRVFNTVIGLLAYIFLFAFLNYLVPGGIL